MDSFLLITRILTFEMKNNVIKQIAVNLSSHESYFKKTLQKVFFLILEYYIMQPLIHFNNCLTVNQNTTPPQERQLCYQSNAK